MGIFGIGREDDGRNTSDSNEDIVKEVATEAASSMPIVEERGKIDPEETQLINTFREVKDPISRRDFLRLAGIFAAGLGVAACTPQQAEQYDPLKSTVEAMRPDPTKTPEIMKEYLLTEDPIRLNPRDFSRRVEGYPNAIIEGSFFAIDENGEALTLTYSGGPFEEVTYLHYTGERPPVVGEILPLMYKVPKDIGNRVEGVVPYALTIQSERGKIDFGDGEERYLVPIVTSGHSTGIVHIMKDGEEINRAYNPFEVIPDSVTKITNGYLSWVVMKKDGNTLVVEGVIESNNSRDGIVIDPNNIPEEVSNLTPEY